MTRPFTRLSLCAVAAFLFFALPLGGQDNTSMVWEASLQRDEDGGSVVTLKGVSPLPLESVHGEVEWTGCAGNECFSPQTASFNAVSASGGDGAAAPASAAAPSPTAVSQGPPAASADAPLWPLLLEAVLWGVAMLLTPCVFPMVPLTVSFFLRNGGKARAALYGLFIVILYVLPVGILTGVARLTGGESLTADIFNVLSTHWLPNVIFFVVFLVFSASFFGAFELRLPSRWVNAADRGGDRRGVAGTFFLALTLVLVSFSCTGPIVGTVLIRSVRGEFWAPLVTMLAFSVAFALPFVLLAVFPDALRRLPKSGDWLGAVKISLGFVELALGLKFLSVADQVYHWHILDREVYLALWLVIFTLLGLFLAGAIRFRGVNLPREFSFGRVSLVIIDFAFVIYLASGFLGNPLSALSGYLPPAQERAESVRPPAATDLDEALSRAAASGKPLLVMVTGYGCVNCREMEQKVYSRPEIAAVIAEKFETLSLYVDDKTLLDESEWLRLPSGKILKRRGRVNSYVASERFGVNSQPNCLILSPDGKVLAGPYGYNTDPESFLEFISLK